jgi:hypothetical protein
LRIFLQFPVRIEQKNYIYFFRNDTFFFVAIKLYAREEEEKKLENLFPRGEQFKDVSSIVYIFISFVRYFLYIFFFYFWSNIVVVPSIHFWCIAQENEVVGILMTIFCTCRFRNATVLLLRIVSEDMDGI